ncbi:uncharacterized protein [Oscarella lobularis]|uniref:uncharacterized protein isoform X1 n=1 Tax=Oscarella lobularis TaxID=121494 RepID=UPI0033136397
MAARDEEEEEIPEVEADGFQKGDRKGDEEKKALCLLNYDVSHVNIARVPRGQFVQGMHYPDIWLGERSVPPVLLCSKNRHFEKDIRGIVGHIECSIEYRKQEYRHHSGQEYHSESPPTNKQSRGHWYMIQALESFVSYCKKAYEN